jgi:hypothetical protein
MVNLRIALGNPAFAMARNQTADRNKFRLLISDSECAAQRSFQMPSGNILPGDVVCLKTVVGKYMGFAPPRWFSRMTFS